MKLIPAKNEFTLEPVNSGKVFRIRAYNSADYHKWTTLIMEHKKESRGDTLGLSWWGGDAHFWKEVRISEPDFAADVENCDLMLFRSKKLNNSYTKVFRQHYDHIALLLRYSNSEIVLFEASQRHGNGVSLLRWSDFKRNNYHSLYEKIVFRKLITPRNLEFVKLLEEFCGNTLGSKS